MKHFGQVNIESFSQPSAESKTEEQQGELCAWVLLLFIRERRPGVHLLSC